MYIFWFNIFLVLVWGLASINSSKKVKILIYLILFVQLYTILAARHLSVGSDTLNYVFWFERSKLYNFFDFSYSRHETGYLLLNKVLSFINNPQIFIAIIAFIQLIIIYLFIIKESRYPIISVFLFISFGFYSDLFNLFRQMLALSILLLSYNYLKKNDFTKYVIIVVIASLFHISALSFLVLWFTKKIEPRFRNLLLYFTIAILTYLFSGEIIRYSLEYFSTRSNITVESSGGLNLLILLIVILLIGYMLKRNILKNENNSIILFNVLSAGVFAQVIALQFSLFTRITSYFAFFIIIFIPEIIHAIENKYIRIISIMFIINLGLIYYYYSLLRNSSGVLPYQFFFNH